MTDCLGFIHLHRNQHFNTRLCSKKSRLQVRLDLWRCNIVAREFYEYHAAERVSPSSGTVEEGEDSYGAFPSLRVL